jgi:quercetin dioxygenase-like cupin family protein
MKRNSFLSAILLIVTAPLNVLGMNSARLPMNRPTRGFKITKGEGRLHGSIKLGGPTPSIIDVKISGSDTEGDMAFFEQTLLSKGANVPLHVHPDQDEYFYVLEGTYRFRVGDELHQLEAGDSIFLPRNIPHAWILLSEQGKSSVLVQPAGKLENFFVVVSKLDHRPSVDEMNKISADCGMNVVGPRLTLD